jgi:hypothetical protein
VFIRPAYVGADTQDGSGGADQHSREADKHDRMNGRRGESGVS